MKKIVYKTEYYKRGIDFTFFGLINLLNLKINGRYLSKTLRPGKRVLEVGCGKGELSRELEKFGYIIDAVDISKEAIEIAKKQTSKVGFINGDIFNLERSDNYYDHIFSFHTMEHIKDIEITLKEIRRILKIGGKILVRIPNSNSWEAKIAGKDWYHRDEPYHVHHFTDLDFVSLLEKVGFKNTKVRYLVFEFRQVLLYSLLTKMFKIKKINNAWKFITLPLQFVFVPLSYVLAVFNNSGTIEIVGNK